MEQNKLHIFTYLALLFSCNYLQCMQKYHSDMSGINRIGINPKDEGLKRYGSDTTLSKVIITEHPLDSNSKSSSDNSVDGAALIEAINSKSTSNSKRTSTTRSSLEIISPLPDEIKTFRRNEIKKDIIPEGWPIEIDPKEKPGYIDVELYKVLFQISDQQQILRIRSRLSVTDHNDTLDAERIHWACVAVILKKDIELALTERKPINPETCKKIRKFLKLHKPENPLNKIIDNIPTERFDREAYSKVERTLHREHIFPAFTILKQNGLK